MYACYVIVHLPIDGMQRGEFCSENDTVVRLVSNQCEYVWPTATGDICHDKRILSADYVSSIAHNVYKIVNR